MFFLPGQKTSRHNFPLFIQITCNNLQILKTIGWPGRKNLPTVDKPVLPSRPSACAPSLGDISKLQFVESNVSSSLVESSGDKSWCRSHSDFNLLCWVVIRPRKWSRLSSSYLPPERVMEGERTLLIVTVLEGYERRLSHRTAWTKYEDKQHRWLSERWTVYYA